MRHPLPEIVRNSHKPAAHDPVRDDAPDYEERDALEEDRGSSKNDRDHFAL